MDHFYNLNEVTLVLLATSDSRVNFSLTDSPGGNSNRPVSNVKSIRTLDNCPYSSEVLFGNLFFVSLRLNTVPT